MVGAGVVVGTGVGVGAGEGVGVVVRARVVGRSSLNDDVPTWNVVLLHVVLYKSHNWLLAYEILQQCKSAIHVCWHASKLASCPGDWLSLTSPSLTLQIPLKPVCSHENPIAMIERNRIHMREGVCTSMQWQKA